MDRTQRMILQLLGFAALLAGAQSQCPQGWRENANNCYFFSTDAKPWMEANAFCLEQNSNLMSIQDIEERLWVRTQIGTEIYWIGLTDRAVEGVWEWSDGSPFIPYLSYWTAGQPDNWGEEPGEDCGQVAGGNRGQWNDENCGVRRKYICKHVNANPGPRCDLANGWRQHASDCYKLKAAGRRSWAAARRDCVQEGGDLVSVTSAEEEQFVTGTTDAAWIDLWIGLSTLNLLPWAPNQPDNWENNEDCVHLRGMTQSEPGKLNDDFCTSTREYICKKAKGQGPPPQPPTSGPGWNEKCGSWTPDPFNDYCYQFNHLSMRPWAEARADCVNQGGDLVSITDPFEQAFVQGVIQSTPTGISLWMGGHDSITEGGWEWTDGSPFRYIRWNAGNPDNYNGENCLSILINNGYWNDDNCQQKRGYICKRRGLTPEPPPPHDGFMTALVCQDSTAVLHCPPESVINIQSAFYGRKSDDICPHFGGSEGSCTVEGLLPHYRKTCDNHPHCFVYAHVDADPCPSISKYLEIVYSCEQKVCLHGLGVEDGNVTDTQLSASSSIGGNDPTKARLNGNSCWRPSGSPTSSWIQVNLGQTRKVTGIVVQGCPQNDFWLTEFKIQHSMDETSWTDYTADGQFFPGSTDRDGPVTQLLGTPVSTQYVRILPVGFNGQAGLRFDVLGCTPDYAITCANKPNFDFSNDKMTVHCPARCANAYHRVYGTSVYRGDSNICAAAIHAGVLLNDGGGDCTLLKVAGQDFYPGSTRNGITSLQYNGNYAVSYTFADGALRCSGPDWYEFGEFCYKPFGEKKTWHDARDTCRSLGAELVSIQSMTEQSWLESYLYMATSDAWTGLNDLFVTGMFSWSDGHVVTFTYWAPGEPNNHDGFSKDCVEMLHQTGRWNDVSCTELNTYICKTAKAHYPVPSVKPTVYGCPQGWDAYGYSCYWMEETSRSWSDAKAFCKEQGGFLLHIGDIYEQAHFTVALSGKTGLWWIGLRARGGSTGGVDYIWDTDLPLTFTHWDKDQPDNGDGTCVAMTTGQIGGFWDDQQCSEKHAFVCEKPRPDITPPPNPPTPPQGCADGWTALPHFRNCFRLFHEVDFSMKKSWGAAHEDCVSRGANLVSIHNQEDEEFLALHSKGTSKWIGLKHNPTEGGYSWSDGTPLSHTNWGHGEPNNHEGREECVEMVSSTNGSRSWWNDLNCDAHQDWICTIIKGKNPVLPPVPPPPVPAPDCGSNPGWRKNNNICYYYNDTDVVDFHTAMTRCYHEKALMVSIHDRDEQAYVNTMVGTGDVAAAWIGMRMLGIASGQYMWVDSSPVTYTHWGPGEPNNANGEEQCVQMNRHQGGWNDANCGRAGAGYVCKKFPGGSHTPPPPTQPWEGNCPAGWMLFKDKCFMFKGRKDDLKANWSHARTWCKGQGGELAVIDDQYENDFVASYLRDLELPTWIGLSDLLVENQYAWSDGLSPVLYTNWNEKEPNNAGGTEHCVAMAHGPLMSGRWNDDVCHKDQSFVCSRKKCQLTFQLFASLLKHSAARSTFVLITSSVSTSASSVAPPPPTKSPCPEGYVSWYKSCYRLVEEPAAWDAAQAACGQQGGNLASVDMSYDQAFIAGVVLQGKADAWIGLRRKDEDGSYSWSDGWPVFFTQWGPGEPSNTKDEGCVSMHASRAFHGTWNDTRCDQAKPYVCKISSGLNLFPFPPKISFF
ncbi:secretory phospholipase A2 receptor isoform 3-T3 [Spinachia spinachia]